ncbi:MAG: YqaE/Pmp3 family membrane protein [Fimbriimonadaceae bacterium]|nr:YqaE/Pmp3 family membrane protein [Fimbriimonadaceae bacterium]QYK56109.1 MAG: YqaE/Pmp3 family membrane protein [Fimbriimonadaceae bacterium]
MSWLRVIACILMPPLAVIDRGIRPLILTTILTFFGWIPGVVSALVHSSMVRRA